jgi:very-short-patch-repair endonuclease
LWKELRKLRARGYHFRRQHPVEVFVVDFACLSQMLIIEVDGIQHLEAEHAKADAARDARLHWLGWRVLRFSNGDVANTLDGIVLEVLAALGAVAKQE